jgi:hypothetical protein
LDLVVLAFVVIGLLRLMKVVEFSFGIFGDLEPQAFCFYGKTFYLYTGFDIFLSDFFKTFFLFYIFLEGMNF